MGFIFAGDPELRIQSMLKCASHPDNMAIKSPKGGFVHFVLTGLSCPFIPVRDTERGHTREILNGSMVMLLFSVNKGNLLTAVAQPACQMISNSLLILNNIFAIIVLAEPAEHFSNSLSQEGLQVFGVDMME